jgi:hypothetical protein
MKHYIHNRKPSKFRIVAALMSAAFAFSIHPLLGLAVLSALSLPVNPCLGVLAEGGVSTATFDYALKVHYLPTMNSLLNNAAFLPNRFAQMMCEPVGGKEFTMAVRTQRNSGIGFRAARAPLPIGGHSDGLNPKSNHARLWLVLAFDSDVIDLSNKDIDAFGRAMEVEMTGGREDADVALSASLWLDRTARLGRIAGAPAAGVVTLDNDGLPHSTTGNRTIYFEEGMYYDAIDDNGVTTQAGLYCSAINAAANTVTFTLNGAASSGNAADNNWLVRGMVSGEANEYNQGVSGIAATLGSTTNTYWNVDRSQANAARWRPNRISGNGVLFNDALLRKPIDTIAKYGANVNRRLSDGVREDLVILTSLEGVAKYADTLTPDRRYVNTTRLEGGWEAVLCHGIPMVPDRHCPLGHYHYINWADWGTYSPTGTIALDLFAPNGQTIHWIPGYDLWQVMLNAKLEIGCRRPNRQADLYDVAMSAL